jgi:hypothetical protein
LQEFLKSGLNKAEFARRIGRAPEQITRWLAAPGNWELDTISDFLLGTSGAEFDPSISHPLDVPAADHAGPDWLVTSDHNHRYNIDITTIGIYGALCLDPIPFDRLAPRAEDALAEQEWTANDNNKPSALSQAEAYKQRRTSSALAG